MALFTLSYGFEYGRDLKREFKAAVMGSEGMEESSDQSVSCQFNQSVPSQIPKVSSRFGTILYYQRLVAGESVMGKLGRIFRWERDGKSRGESCIKIKRI